MNQLPSTLLGLIGVTVLAVLDELTLLTDAVIGAGIGLIVARGRIFRLERQGRELAGPRVRQLEWTWTLVGSAAAGALYFAVEVL